MSGKALGLLILTAAAAFANTAVAQSSSPFSGLFGGGGEEAGWPVAVDFSVRNPDGSENDSIRKQIRNTSLVTTALAEGRSSGQDMLAAARGDYARILGLLFDEGYFSAEVTILLDGVEAASIAALDAPRTVNQITVDVQSGPRFEFAEASIGPLTSKTVLPSGYATGKTAGTGVIKSAGRDGIEAWRQDGHAKAALGQTEITADHNTRLVYSDVRLVPGPRVTLGQLKATGNERLRTKRLYEIAGFPEGEQYDPELIETVRKRLRRSGIFSAVTLEEAATLGPGDTMDVDLTVMEQKKRRAGAGVEFSTEDGAAISGYWLHRNMWGGGERLIIDTRLSDIGSSRSGRDFRLDTRVERPATFLPDITAFTTAGISRLREEESESDNVNVGIGFTHFQSDNLFSELQLQYRQSRVKDENGEVDFKLLAAIGTLTWDRRDSQTDPKHGFWLKLDATPFIGLDEQTDDGVRLMAEGRLYRSMGEEKKLTFATRMRFGTIYGADIRNIPRDYLFYSGGGGSVRGQPYESLGAHVISGPSGPIKTGGMSVANMTAEMRFQVREKIGMAVFADAGQVWSEGGFGGENDWHAGAGLGVRYLTPIGPLRFDIASPVGKNSDSGVQVYLGLGQAF